MKITNEIETIDIDGVKLDVVFRYSRDFGFDIDYVEDVTGVQDLMPLLESWVMKEIEEKLEDLYRRRGWL
jgi:hypothetical protein